MSIIDDVQIPLPLHHWERFPQLRLAESSKATDLAWSIGLGGSSRILVDDFDQVGQGHLGIFGIDQARSADRSASDGPALVKEQMSELLSFMVSQQCQKNSPRRLNLTVVDPFKTMNDSISRLKHLQDGQLIQMGSLRGPKSGSKSEPEAFLKKFAASLKELSDTAKSRSRLPTSRTLLVINRLDLTLMLAEKALSSTQCSRLKKSLRYLMANGPKVGTHLVVTSCDPSTEVIPAPERDSFRRIGFRSSREGSVLTVGDRTLANLDPKIHDSGKYASDGEAQWFKTFDLTNYPFVGE